MTKIEFENELSVFDCNEGIVISDADYKIIEFVYSFYPTLSEVNGKKEIAGIYTFGGMTVINDMFARAKEAQKCEQAIASCKGELNRLSNEYIALKDCNSRITTISSIRL